MGKLTAMDTEGFSLEEVEGSEVEEEEEGQMSEGDQDCSEKQVICTVKIFIEFASKIYITVGAVVVLELFTGFLVTRYRMAGPPSKK